MTARSRPETFQELAHPGLLDGGHRCLERLGVPHVALPPAVDVDACPTGRGYQPRLGLADLAVRPAEKPSDCVLVCVLGILGVVLLVERENKDSLIPLFITCRRLRDRVIEDVISVGVMTDDIKGVRMIGVDVAVPYRGSPEDLIGPLAAGIEGRRGRNPSF